MTGTSLRIGRSDLLPFAQPTIEDSDVDEVIGVLRSGWLTSGRQVRGFEKEFAAEVNAAAGLAVSSGTAAMHLALISMGVAPGSAVITTPLTFCSTAHVIEQVGCRPLFVDVEPETLNLDPSAIREVLEASREDFGAILPVHYGGHPCELDEILALGRLYNLPVVEDAAHAFGASFRGTPIGEIGEEVRSRVACFSLYATKNITSGEGGVLTGAGAVIEKARPWSVLGMSRDSLERYGPRGSWEYEVLVAGFKYNMSDIQAALGRAQLRRWHSMQERRAEIASLYSRMFIDVEEVEAPKTRRYVTPAWHLYPLRLRLERLTIDRAQFIDELRLLHIGTSVHFIPLHLQPYYRERYQYARGDFPVAVAEFERLISLPIYPRMTDGDVDDVVAAIRHVIARNRRRL